MRRIWEDEDTEAILFVDAANAFNALNRKAALHNVQYTCPELSTFVKNIYNGEAERFLSNSTVIIYSREGTTQGGPELMGFYVASTTVLTNPDPDCAVKKVFYADDGNAGGKLTPLHSWWTDFKLSGPPHGYFPEASKSWLLVKPAHEERARELFTDVNITVEGRKFLGSYIGTAEATEAFVNTRIGEWEKVINALAAIATSEPQLAYSAYVYGTSRRWQFLCRTTPGIANAMKGIETRIRNNLIPAIMGSNEISDNLRKILCLPARLGGMGFANPTEEALLEYENSKMITAQLPSAVATYD